MPLRGARQQVSEPQNDEVLERVKALMLRLAAGERFERLGAIVQEHLFTGGKRLRARLALDGVRAFGGDDDRGVAWAAACELLHNATLVHDDLQDADPMRRGQFTVWMRHGQSQAINAGDLLLMLPYIAVEHVPVDDGTRWHLARATARRAEQTVRGQSLEMSLLSSGRTDWASYAAAATGKTSALMALPVHGAALIGGRVPEEAESLSAPFSELGLLFQIQDDVLDLFGDKGRDEVGGDLREGRVSALVCEHLRLNPGQKGPVVEILARPRGETTDLDVSRMRRAFENEGALGAVVGRIRALERSILDAPALENEPRLRGVATKLVALCTAPIEHILGEHS